MLRKNPFNILKKEKKKKRKKLNLVRDSYKAREQKRIILFATTPANPAKEERD